MNDHHARQLLLHLFNDQRGRYLELTYIAPPGVTVDGPRVWSESYHIGTQRPDWERVGAFNANGYGVYYALTPKIAPLRDMYTRTKEHGAACVQCLWVDIDEKGGTSKREAYSALVHHTPPPTLIIDSGGGLHGIWRIVPEDITPDSKRAIKGVIRNMARAFGGDAVQDFARVFRLPGTINTKPERNGAECRVIGTPRDVLYEFGWFRDYLPAERSTRDFPPPRTDRPDSMPAYVAWYLGHYPNEGERNEILNWVAWKMRHDGFSKDNVSSLIAAHAIAGGLTEREVSATIESPFKAK